MPYKILSGYRVISDRKEPDIQFVTMVFNYIEVTVLNRSLDFPLSKFIEPCRWFMLCAQGCTFSRCNRYLFYFQHSVIIPYVYHLVHFSLKSVSTLSQFQKFIYVFIFQIYIALLFTVKSYFSRIFSHSPNDSDSPIMLMHRSHD